MNVPFVFYDRQYLNLKSDIDSAQQRVMAEGQLILREEVSEFEKHLAEFVGTTYAVAVNSGTDALAFSLVAVGVSPGGEVITSAHTFKATVGAILAVGAVPVIVDIGNDGLIDCDALASKIRIGKTQAIIPVHIAGDVCNMNQIMALADEFKIPVVEDACQALGAIVGKRGIVQCWSFYPAKILGGNDDGGAITTDHFGIYDYVKGVRNHFKEDNRSFGTNSRMGNIRAAVLNVKIKQVRKYLARRHEIAQQYLSCLSFVGLPRDNPFRVWQDFIVRTQSRDPLKNHLKNRGIETMLNEYTFSPTYPKKLWSVASKYEAETLRLPLNSEMTDDEVNAVVKAVNSFTP